VNLQLKPTPVNPLHFLAKTRQFKGVEFCLGGHYAFRYDHFYSGRVDCLRYPLFVLRELGLWPDEWRGELPLELRRIRFLRGDNVLGIGDYPAIQELLALNFDKVERTELQSGDLLGFQLRDVPRMAASIHHVAILDRNQIWHCLPESGVTKHDLDGTWANRLMCGWRLKNFGVDL
jgi:hypothetical protein